MSRAASDRLSQVLSRYRELCAWCDELFAAALTANRAHMVCAPGCAMCCTLTTVTPLEAHAVSAYLRENPGQAEAIRQCLPGTRAGAPALDHEMCPLLLHRQCAVYPARPIICRTHGLAVRYTGTGALHSCPMNFRERDPGTLAPEYVLDSDRITENLMRLNLAFCRITGRDRDAGQRVALASVLQGAANGSERG